MHEHLQKIELYINAGDDRQNNKIEQILAAANLDDIVTRTLQAVGVNRPVMLTLLLTDDEGIREMNKQYRQQDKPTDVLSFPLLEQPLVTAPADQLWQPLEDTDQSQRQQVQFVTPPDTIMNLGDIVMSWPTIERQALEAGHSPAYELLYLLAHGVLHLVGYDDLTEAGYEAMVHIQQMVLAASGQKA
jgi:probable rRNA maturation factor